MTTASGRDRRQFTRSSIGFVAGAGLLSSGCGTALSRLAELTGRISVWSYYAPLIDYADLFDDFDQRHELDRRVDLAAVQRVSRRISGRRDDGTNNRTEVDPADVQSDEYLRVRFWHDDTFPSGRGGHSLYLFPRYLEPLAAGEPVFVATGITQGHFHIVMLEAQS